MVDSRFPSAVEEDNLVAEPATVVTVVVPMVTVAVEVVIAACAGVSGDVTVEVVAPPARVDAAIVADEKDDVVVAVVVAKDKAPPEEAEVEDVPCFPELWVVPWQAVQIVVVVEAALFASPVWSVGFDWGKKEPAPTRRSARASPPIAPTKNPPLLIPLLISIL